MNLATVRRWIVYCVITLTAGLIVITTFVIPQAQNVVVPPDEPPTSPSIQQHNIHDILDSIATAAPMLLLVFALIIAEFILRDIRSKETGLKAIHGELADIKNGGVRVFSDGSDFYRDLEREIASPNIRAARLTAIRREPTHNKEFSGPYYDAIKKRCKNKRNAFSAKRIIGIPDGDMLRWARNENQAWAKECGPRLAIHAMPWLAEISGVNLAILDGPEQRPQTVYIVMTTGPAITDTTAIKISHQPDVASFFARYFDALYDTSWDVLQEDKMLEIEDVLRKNGRMS